MTVRENTNFKLVPGQNIARTFADPLKIEPEGWQPR